MKSLSLLLTITQLLCVLLLTSCKTKEKNDNEPSEKNSINRQTDDCQEAVNHAHKFLMAGNISDGEKRAMEVVMNSAVKKCRNEGLSSEQKACVMSASNLQEFMDLMACPAIKNKKPSWLSLPPPGTISVPEQ